MSNQTELDPRNQEAIEAALAGNWEKAIQLNINLSEDYPEDVTVLNRLGHAYTELGQINKASTTFKKVLESDPYNPIAKKNLDRLSTLRSSDVKVKENGTKALDPEIFIEEPGKTKTIELTDLAMPKILINLRIGDPVNLNPTKTDVSIISNDNRRLGKLDSAWAKDIASAISLGSEFTAVVKSIKVGKDPDNSSLSVFVRENVHSKKLANPIFPIDTNFTPFVREETLSYLKEPDSSNHEGDENEIEHVENDTENKLHEETDSSPIIDVEEPHADLIEDEEDFSPK